MPVKELFLQKHKKLATKRECFLGNNNIILQTIRYVKFFTLQRQLAI